MGFITLDVEFILSDAIWILDKDEFIMGLSAQLDITEEFELRISQLNKDGYIFALPDFIPEYKYQRYIPLHNNLLFQGKIRPKPDNKNNN